MRITHFYCFFASDLIVVVSEGYDIPHYIVDNVMIRFGLNLYLERVGIPMGTKYPHHIADSILFCYEREFIMSFSADSQANVVEKLSK